MINGISFNLLKYRTDQEINILKAGGNKRHLDIFIQYFPPNSKILVTLQHKYQSVISDFYRHLVSFL